MLGILVVLAACGDSNLAAPQTADAGPPDAPENPDAGPAEPLERIDWRTTRGEPLVTTTVTVPTAELFALSGDGFVLRTQCADPLGCTYTWHDGAGAVKKRREHLIGATATTVSPDGRRALLLAADDVGFCDQADQRFIVDRGTLQLVDLATGEAELNLVLRSNPWSANAFTPDSRWFFAAPLADGACLATRLGYRSAAAPFAEAPGLDGLDIAQVIDPRRWLGFRASVLGVVDPGVAGSFLALGDESSPFDAGGGWVHAYVGPHELAHEIVSLSPDDAVRRTPVEQDEDWFGTQAFGRWVRVCGFRQLPGFRQCRIIDVLGERSPVNVRVIDAPDHPDDAILIGAGAFVFVEPNGDQRAVKRVDLMSGRLETLHDGDGQLFPLGDGEAALLFQGFAEGDAWLIEARREELLAPKVRFVLTVPHLFFLKEYQVRQHDVALLVQTAGDAELSLFAFDLGTRRLAQLTERLYLTPQFEPRFAVTNCGEPWMTRHAGGPVEGLIQDATHLFFVEQPATEGGPAVLFTLPIDLSAPPRRLATLSDPSLCHPPLTDPSGDRVGFLEHDPVAGGVRITVGEQTGVSGTQ